MAVASQESLHWSLAGIEENLSTFSLPRGDFDPHGRWTHRYLTWINTINSLSPSREQGYAIIQRRPLPEAETIELQVEQSGDFAGWCSQVTRATIQCMENRLARPVSWKVESSGINKKDKNAVYPKFEERAKVADGRVIRTGKRTRRVKIPEAFTLDWALFDAVQRFKGEKITPIEFDMFEDFDLLRPKQRLSYEGTTEVKLGGKTTRLVGYRQIGEGILPIHYWLDEQYRLLFVIGGCRIYLLDSRKK